MNKEKMTIHKALAELKILGARIESAIDSGDYCVANKHSNDKINGIPIDECKSLMQSRYDKAKDLIRRRNAIKRAVVLSNAVTKVKVNDVEYAVAEAIEMKNHGIEFDEMLLDAMKSQYSKAQAMVMRNNGKELEERAEKYVIGVFGTKEGKVNTDEIEKTRKIFLENNSYEILDPLKIADKIEMFEDKINAFKSEIDSALSVSNSVTEIEIEY